MKKLRRLDLTGTLVTDEGLKYMSDLTDMEDLNLYGVKVTDRGVQYLSKLTKLRSLNPLTVTVRGRNPSRRQDCLSMALLRLPRCEEYP